MKAARCKGVSPIPFLALTSAPFYEKKKKKGKRNNLFFEEYNNYSKSNFIVMMFKLISINNKCIVFKTNLQNRLLEVLMEEDDYVGIPFLIKKFQNNYSK